MGGEREGRRKRERCEFLDDCSHSVYIAEDYSIGKEGGGGGEGGRNSTGQASKMLKKRRHFLLI